MAEIEIEGADKHEMEHRTSHGDNLSVKIAVMTVLMAIVAVIFNVYGEELGDKSGELKTEAQQVRTVAGEFRTKAGNQWGYYQAKSTKGNLADMVVVLASDASLKERYAAESKRYAEERAEIQTEARKLDARADLLDAEADVLNAQSEIVKRPKESMKYALPLLQVAIALASITALTKVKPMLWAAVLFAVAGIVVGVLAIRESESLPDEVGRWRAEHPEAHTPEKHGHGATREAH